MKVWIAGKALGENEVQAFAGSDRVAFEEEKLLTLKDARDESDFLERFLSLQLSRCGLAPEAIPAAGPIGRVRSMLWKLLRPGLDVLWFKQSHINAQLHYALRFEQQEQIKLRQELDELKQRLARLEDQS